MEDMTWHKGLRIIPLTAAGNNHNVPDILASLRIIVMFSHTSATVVTRSLSRPSSPVKVTFATEMARNASRASAVIGEL